VLASDAGALEPGLESATVVLVRNTGMRADDFLVAVQGPASVWARVEPAVLRLEPGEEGAAWVRFSPPLTAVTPAGPVPYFVAVTPRAEPDVVVIEKGLLEVAGVARVRAALGPPGDSGRRWVDFPLKLVNDGNAPATVEVGALGDDRRFLFDIGDTPAELLPGAAAEVLVRVRGPRRGPDRDRAFRVAVAAASTGDGSPGAAVRDLPKGGPSGAEEPEGGAPGGSEPVAVVEGVFPAGSTLASELSRSAIALAVVLVVALVLGVRALRAGSGSGGGPGAAAAGGAIGIDPGAAPDPTGGGPATTVAADDASLANLSPAPDLPTLVFVRTYSPTDRDLVVRFGGSAAHELRLQAPGATESKPAMSPTGAQVAYIREQAGVWRVCVVAATGGDARCLADAAASSAVAWFPSGDRLLFSRADTLLSVPVAGGEPEELPARIADGAFSLSADGTRVVFAAGGRLVVRNLDGSGGIQIAVPSDATDARWSPDGSRIVYASQYQVFTAPAGDGPVRRVTAEGTVNNEPVWSPDGGWIVFRSTRSGNGDLFAARAGSQGGAETGLARLTSSPERDLSPSF